MIKNQERDYWQRWQNRLSSRSYEVRTELARLLLDYPTVPPAAMRRRIGDVCPINWNMVASEFVAYLKLLAGLTPRSAVLEIGCGPGRIASHLMHEIGPQGSYYGFDIQKSYIEFCQRKISSGNSSFRFHHVNVFNDVYNPNGTMLAQNFAFPLEDESVDIVFATSVFTHVLPEVTAHYVAETARVMRSEGVFLFTCYTLDYHDPEQSSFCIVPLPPHEGVAVHDLASPGLAVVYNKAWIHNACSEAGMVIAQAYPGRWSGTQNNPLSDQDVVIAKRS